MIIDIQAGINIVRRALESPIRQISENAGVEGSIVVGKVLESKGKLGFDAQNEVYMIWSLQVSSTQPKWCLPL